MPDRDPWSLTAKQKTILGLCTIAMLLIVFGVVPLVASRDTASSEQVRENTRKLDELIARSKSRTPVFDNLQSSLNEIQRGQQAILRQLLEANQR